MEKFIMPNHLPFISTFSILSLLLVLPNSGSANDKRNSQALQLAQTEKVIKSGKYRKRKGQRQGRYFMRLYDTNNDGKVTPDEIADDQVRMLNAIDLNNDKSLSVDEMRRRGRSLQIWRSVTLFDLLDTNGNQKISAEELSAPMKRLFKRYDVNNDNGLSVNEMRRRGRNPKIWRSATLFELLDTNGDQKISAQELSAPMKRWFKRYDANGDGFIENYEVKRKRYKRRGKQRGRQFR
jgi:hypothetical protein